MKDKLNQIAAMATLLMAIGCAETTPDALKEVLVAQNYWLVNANNDSTQVEFLETCTRHFNWQAFIVNEWELKEVDGQLMLNFDTHDFEPKQSADGGFEFHCAKTGERLVKAAAATYNSQALLGTWEDAHYSGKQPGELPPCPNGSPSVPSITFKADNCTIQDFCASKVEPCQINALAKIICVGDPCAAGDQWKIKELSGDKLVLDMRRMDGDKLSYEFNKWYVRVKG